METESNSSTDKKKENTLAGRGPGHTNNPSGRPKGSKSAVTIAMKEMMVEFVRNNMGTMQELYDRVAEEDPKTALHIMLKAMAYVIPTKVEADITTDQPIQIIFPTQNNIIIETPKDEETE